jgi:hypothetical protein
MINYHANNYLLSLYRMHIQIDAIEENKYFL